MFIAEALLKTARDLNEPGEALDNFEYVRGQAELIVDALGYSQEDAKVAVMAYLSYLMAFDQLMDILYERMSLSDDVTRIIDQAHEKYMRQYLKSKGL